MIAKDTNFRDFIEAVVSIKPMVSIYVCGDPGATAPVIPP
jgi:hypothetical protein